MLQFADRCTVTVQPAGSAGARRVFLTLHGSDDRNKTIHLDLVIPEHVANQLGEALSSGSVGLAREVSLMKVAADQSAARVPGPNKQRRRRIPPSKEQLEHMLSTHLSFEINRFTRGVELWREKLNGDTSVDDMILEACLIHMRLLLDFFFPRQWAEEYSPHRDIFVSDYIPNDQCPARLKSLLVPMPNWVPKYRSKLDRQTAHLTMRRAEIKNKYPWHGWKDIQRPFSHMEKLIEAFIQALPLDMRVLFNPMHGWPGSESARNSSTVINRTVLHP